MITITSSNTASKILWTMMMYSLTLKETNRLPNHPQNVNDRMNDYNKPYLFKIFKAQ